MNFTDWYEIEENSKVLKVNKNIEKLDSYNEEKYDYTVHLTTPYG